ncbi:MAG: hypothetical protein GY924_04110, partial [Planctomycetaceae bacterium]|nr:hypothetical protein [Planctomycetaceae bacterium]
MSRQLLLHQLPFRLAILAAVAFQSLLVQTAWCQTNQSEANAPAAETNAQAAAEPAGKDSAQAAAKPVTVNPNVTT